MGHLSYIILNLIISLYIPCYIFDYSFKGAITIDELHGNNILALFRINYAILFQIGFRDNKISS